MTRQAHGGEFANFISRLRRKKNIRKWKKWISLHSTRHLSHQITSLNTSLHSTYHFTPHITSLNISRQSTHQFTRHITSLNISLHSTHHVTQHITSLHTSLHSTQYRNNLLPSKKQQYQSEICQYYFTHLATCFGCKQPSLGQNRTKCRYIEGVHCMGSHIVYNYWYTEIVR